MRVELSHADTCYSDYWSGHRNPHLMVPAYPRTIASVRHELHGELSQGMVCGNSLAARLLAGELPDTSPETRRLADRLHRAVVAAINRVTGKAKGQRMVFTDCEAPGDDVWGDVYGYFVVMPLDDEARDLLEL